MVRVPKNLAAKAPSLNSSMWHKHGLIFAPENQADWFVSHAALPTVQRLDDGLFRIYFAGRDADNRAQIGFFDCDFANGYTIKQVSSEPVIRFGSLGAYHDRGVTTAWVVAHDGKQYQYFTGWSLGVTVPFYFNIGLAIAEDGSYRASSEAPIMGRHPVDPFLCASPCVLIENGLWRMWYVSGVRWSVENDAPKHYYHIKYAESEDGIHWQRDGRVCIDFKSADEYAISRPCVIKDGDVYKMWYASRGEAYRIGYAESSDGLTWTREDETVGIDVGDSGWDSEMMAYPCVFDDNGTRYMLYNGNGYGKTGIGLAVWR